MRKVADYSGWSWIISPNQTEEAVGISKIPFSSWMPEIIRLPSFYDFLFLAPFPAIKKYEIIISCMILSLFYCGGIERISLYCLFIRTVWNCDGLDLRRSRFLTEAGLRSGSSTPAFFDVNPDRTLLGGHIPILQVVGQSQPENREG